MPSGKELAEINKKLDSILNELKNKRDDERKALKNLITKLIAEWYTDSRMDRKMRFAEEFSRLFFSMLNVILYQSYPELQSELDDETLSKIKTYSNELELRNSKSDSPK